MIPHVPGGEGLALRITGLHKRFGKHRALDDLSLSVPRGSICGLIGPNGAGKTTTMSIIAGFLQADSGTVDLLGMGPFDPSRHAGRVGILPQDAELPVASTPRQLLTVWGRLQGIPASQIQAAVQEVLALVLLGDRADARIATLSHGMRRRVTVASALVGDPAFVLLDEPTSGLDPAQARHLRDALAGLRGKTTVLISSHNLAELESLCDRVVVIDHGRCVREGDMATVTGADREVTITLAPPYPEGLTTPVVLSLDRADPRSLPEATSERLAELLAAGARIQEVRQGSSLEARVLADTAGTPPPTPSGGGRR
ncbi:MAG: ABC transporter ATP-binding protein [Myxococcales bacterium]|nr:ABC transporter ATP-binding protein [Myxococcales bacterium]